MTRGDTRDERGAAALEFALVAGILITLVFAILELGRTFSHYEVLQAAAREGARAAAVRGAPGDVLDAVTSAAAGYEIGPGAPVQSIVCDDTTIGEPVSVSWTQAFDIVIPLLPSMTRSVEITGVFRCE